MAFETQVVLNQGITALIASTNNNTLKLAALEVLLFDAIQKLDAFNSLDIKPKLYYQKLKFLESLAIEMPYGEVNHDFRLQQAISNIKKSARLSHFEGFLPSDHEFEGIIRNAEVIADFLHFLNCGADIEIISDAQVENDNHTANEEEGIGTTQIAAKDINEKLQFISAYASIVAKLPNDIIVEIQNGQFEGYFIALSIENADTKLLRKYAFIDDTIHILRSEIRYEAQYSTTSNMLINYVIEAPDVVLLPDILINVTSICSVFDLLNRQKGLAVKSILPEMMKPKTPGLNLLKGVIVNGFLDDLIFNYQHNKPNEEFGNVAKRLFARYGIELSYHFNEDGKADKKELLRWLEVQYDNLSHIVRNRFRLGKTDRYSEIEPSDCILEPAFISPEMGITGRLDVLHVTNRDGRTSYDVVELKSGKPPTKLWPAQLAQIALYRDCLKSTYGENGYAGKVQMLYSQDTITPLRKVSTAELNAAEIGLRYARNLILSVINGISNATMPQQVYDFTKYIDVDELKALTNKNSDNLSPLYYVEDTNLQQVYYTSMIRMAMIEKKKTWLGNGKYGFGCNKFWLATNAQKEADYQLISEMKLMSSAYNNEGTGYLQIVFERTLMQSCNFKLGQELAIYATSDRNGKAINIGKEQLHRATLLSISDSYIKVQLRNQQIPAWYFKQISSWAAEPYPDDSASDKLLQGMASFKYLPNVAKDVFMGLKKPSRNNFEHKIRVNEHSFYSQLHSTQSDALNKIAASKDYFLLIGPPGSGKTKVIMRSALRNILENSTNKVLLAGYTNRAVDELCNQCIDLLNDGVVGADFIRIAKHANTPVNQQQHLLSEKISNLKSTDSLQALLIDTRVVAGTIFSLLGKPELLLQMQFDVLILDEASQVLEPFIWNLLTYTRRIIAIGDPMQLPAITQLDDIESKPFNADANIEICFENVTESWFERMLRNARYRGWVHCYGFIGIQGRTIPQIASFLNAHYYHGNYLPIRPQVEVSTTNLDAIIDYNQLVSLEGFAFINLPQLSTVEGYNVSKINKVEVYEIMAVVEALLLKNNQIPFAEESLGIIAPFRNQVALIRQNLETKFGSFAVANVIVDTVERFQGGQCETILYSTTVSHPNQLASIQSNAYDSFIDRKLNVSLSRAKNRLIVFGNEPILATNKHYNSLMIWAKASEAFFNLNLTTQKLEKPALGYILNGKADVYNAFQLINEGKQGANQNNIGLDVVIAGGLNYGLAPIDKPYVHQFYDGTVRSSYLSNIQIALMRKFVTKVRHLQLDAYAKLNLKTSNTEVFELVPYQDHFPNPVLERLASVYPMVSQQKVEDFITLTLSKKGTNMLVLLPYCLNAGSISSDIFDSLISKLWALKKQKTLYIGLTTHNNESLSTRFKTFASLLKLKQVCPETEKSWALSEPNFFQILPSLSVLYKATD